MSKEKIVMSKGEINNTISDMRGHVLVPFGHSIKVCKRCNTRDCFEAIGLFDWHADANWPTLLREMLAANVRGYLSQFGAHFEYIYGANGYGEIASESDISVGVCNAWLNWKEMTK